MKTELKTDLADEIREVTNENVFLCYQCTKCTSGCPLAEHFDLAPNQVMRAAQLGMKDEIFNSLTPWLCASCQTCTTRCPQGIDIARIMDYLVGEMMAQGIKSKVPEVAIFNKVFLRDVDILGRSYELGLMLEMNLRTKKPFKDVDLGLDMIKHGKINFLPSIVRSGRRKAPSSLSSRPANEVGYYPGCSLHSLAKEFNHSAIAVMEALDEKPIEPKGWICCGSSPAHRVDHKLSVKMPLESLVLYEQEGVSEVTLPCAMCFNRFRAAARELKLNPELKRELDQEVGYEFHNDLVITSLLDHVVERIGLETIASKVKKPLEGLKVACYYGCLLTRPPEITGSKEPEYPMAMDHLVKALGATPIDWDRKVSCCGASLSLTRTDLVFEMSGDILRNAHARQANMVAVACPMCHANLDGRQAQIEGLEPIPSLYFTQLMALAFGMPKEAALKYNMVDPRPLLTDLGLM
jgi:heterodisulfide reductase subunit B